MANAITLYIPSNSLRLPDNDQWTNRFNLHSSSSNRVYTVAQNKKKRFWGCDCMGWKRYRKCHHLREMGIPCHEQPFEAVLHE